MYPAPSVVAAAAEAEAEGSSPGGTGPAGGAKKCKGGEGRSSSAPCAGTTKASRNTVARAVMEERQERMLSKFADTSAETMRAIVASSDANSKATRDMLQAQMQAQAHVQGNMMLFFANIFSGQPMNMAFSAAGFPPSPPCRPCHPCGPCHPCRLCGPCSLCSAPPSPQGRPSTHLEAWLVEAVATATPTTCHHHLPIGEAKSKSREQADLFCYVMYCTAEFVCTV